MYEKFFGLSAMPFNNTPDPRFFFESPAHQEALASLHYAARHRKGFALVTGEVGSGKTLLSRLLLNQLGPTASTALVTNTRLTGAELLAAIGREFNLPADAAESAAQLARRLEEFLLQQYARNRLAVVILDEAQNLPLDAFEDLRMLGNLEADDAKLIQVLMLGQPELQETFAQPSMRQLRQRMVRSFHLRAMLPELTEAYIRHRLTIAGWPPGRVLFEPAAIEAIYAHSQGIPRVINQLCDDAMMAAYVASSRRINARLVESSIEPIASAPDSVPAERGRDPSAVRPTQPTRRPDNTGDAPEPVEPSPEPRRAEVRSCITVIQRSVHQLAEQLNARMTASETQLSESVARLESELADRLRTTQRTQEVDAEKTRRQTAEVLQQAQRLLVRTQEQSAALLAHLRAEVARQTALMADAWKEVVVREKSDVCDLEARIESTRRQAADGVELLQRALAEIHARGSGCIADIRVGLAQLSERGEHLLADLSSASDALRRESSQLVDQAKETTAEASRQVDALRAEAQEQRRQLENITQRAEREAQRVGANVSALAEQVQAGAASLLTRAHEVAEQAQTTARSTLDEVRRSQEAAADEARRVRDELEIYKRELREARAEAEAARRDARLQQEQARCSAEQSLERAEAVKRQIEALVNPPQQVIDNANRRVAALTELSTKVGRIVQQLAATSRDAVKSREALVEAGAQADQRVAILRRDTQRLGQLLGLIRQLYGTMDAREDSFRRHLSAADQNFRLVPREIDQFQALFDADERPAPPASDRTTLHSAPAPVSRLETRSPRPPAPTARATLGQIVERNKRLNAWLQPVLEENREELAAEPAASAIPGAGSEFDRTSPATPPATTAGPSIGGQGR